MCTYEHLVEVTLAARADPAGRAQLRTITLGGAVTGLGIESTSFRSGLPHESVLEMDVLTGSGEIVTTQPGDDLFDAFPNSYGSLGYATRLRIELEPVAALRRPPPRPLRRRRRPWPTPIDARSSTTRRVGRRAGRRPRRRRLRARRGLPDARPLDRRARADQRLHRPAGLLPLDPAARDRPADRCTTTCGAGTPTGSGARARSAPSTRVVRRVWPRRLRRSDVYWRLRRARPPLRHRRPARPARRPPAGRAGRAGRRGAGRPAGGVPRLVRRRGRHAPGVAVPAALAPGAAPERDRPWPAYPLTAGTTYVNVGFWGNVHVGPDAPTSPRNRAIEAEGARARRPQDALLRGVLRRARSSTRSTTAPTSPR